MQISTVMLDFHLKALLCLKSSSVYHNLGLIYFMIFFFFTTEHLKTDYHVPQAMNSWS